MDPSSVSRRNLLKVAGGAGTGLFLAGCGDPHQGDEAKDAASGIEAFKVPRREEKWVPSVCGQCPAGCGILVKVIAGKAIKVEGNPKYPLNQGGVGPKGQAGLQLLYHPDRLRGPLRREGPRGSTNWKPVSWDVAIDEISKQLRDLRDSGDARGLVLLDGEPRGMMPALWERFLEAYGSPNHVSHRSATDGAKVLATQYMHGVAELPAYDWPRARYVLSLEANLFESWCSLIHCIRSATQLRWSVPGHRVKIVQVSPRFSVTAAKADEWISIEPATFGALALGLAHVLIRDNLYDKDFVREHTFGFEAWKDTEGREHQGFRNVALAGYAPEKVASLTGIPSETIVRIAHEMSDHRPALAIADGNAAAATNGLGTAMAIHALNALLGNLERPGGMLLQQPVPWAPWPSIQCDEVAKKNRIEPRIDGAAGQDRPLARTFIQGLPEAILSGKPYPVKALFLYRSNPIFSKPGGASWSTALQKVPLVVSFSPLPDESALWADYVLPDHTYFERWEPVEPIPSVGFPLFGLRQPVVPPVHGTMATGDVVIRLAKSLGSPVADAFPWDDYRAAAIARFEGLLRAQGVPSAPDMENLLKKLEEEGGWWASNYPFERWQTAFRTPSGKFEFYSQEIARRLEAAFPNVLEREKRLAAIGIETRGDLLCLPHWEPPRFAGNKEEYPFLLLPYRGIEYAEGGARHLPLLRELPLAGFTSWRERIDVHPEDARRLDILEGEEVWAESPASRLRVTVRTDTGTRPGTIGFPLGHGAWPPNPGSSALASGYSLLMNHADPLAGILALQGTRVRLRKGPA